MNVNNRTIKMLLLTIIFFPALFFNSTLLGKEIIPLKLGKYVQKGVPCNDAETAAVIYFKGNNFDCPKVSGVIKNIKKVGDVYQVELICQEFGAKENYDKFKIEWSIKVHSNTEFTIYNVKYDGQLVDKSSTTYRYCPE